MQDQEFRSSNRFKILERKQTCKYPYEQNTQNDVCLYRIPDDAGGPYSRCRYDDGRWSVEEDPDKISRACETNEGGEAHQNIEELLDLVYFPHDAHRT